MTERQLFEQLIRQTNQMTEAERERIIACGKAADDAEMAAELAADEEAEIIAELQAEEEPGVDMGRATEGRGRRA